MAGVDHEWLPLTLPANTNRIAAGVSAVMPQTKSQDGSWIKQPGRLRSNAG